MFKRIKSINKGVFIDNSVKSPTKEINSSEYIGKINNGYFLPVIKATVNSIKANCLLDSGASDDFISINFARKHGILINPIHSKKFTQNYDNMVGNIYSNDFSYSPIQFV